MSAPSKDTIYIDIDDEITAIIDKLRGSSAKVVAFVLPKRATTLQSIVNMKLLKRAADQEKKNLVLVTTESGLMPLAGAVGLHVAATPTSRPQIPAAPKVGPVDDEVVDENAELSSDSDQEPELDANAPVGDLASPNATPPPKAEGIETLQLDNQEEAPEEEPLPAAAVKSPKPNKKLKVPDFDKFRLLSILGVLLLIVLVVGWYVAFVVMPRAKINIKTNASNVNTNVSFALNTTATALNEDSKTVPAKKAEQQKTFTGSAPATGQKNNGTTATGAITLSSSCSNGVQIVPSGIGVSSGGQTYIIQQSVTLKDATGMGKNCVLSGSADITAQAAGAKYNASGGTKFTVSGKNDTYDGSTITASGSASGGTDNIQTVVSQADIDAAKAKINTSAPDIQKALSDQLKGQGMYVIDATYTVGQPTITTSNNAGDQASSVTVTEAITYTVYGAKESDLKTLVGNAIKAQIDTTKQNILTEGITQGAFKLMGPAENGLSLNLQTVAEVGPSLDVADLTKQFAGKKAGDIKAVLASNPDVTGVDIKLSPFWVSKAPKDLKKITVTVAKPTKTAQ
ncbi:hypothetical protein KC976_00060 [Candidatus Saccharibacteria bacterium]|nr:hypothetical protein [Candidatus Saccharibacteria bacterium]